MNEQEKRLIEHILEVTSKDAIRDNGRFWRMANDKTVPAWGFVEPILFEGFRFVFLKFSPQSKGQKSLVVYDYITETEYQKDKDNKLTR